MDIRTSVETGDILRTALPDPAKGQIDKIYLGNGRMGCCLDAFGLMHTPYNHKGVWKTQNTVLCHGEHFSSGRFDMDYLLPVLRIFFQESPPAPEFYRQHCRLYEGYVETQIHWRTQCIKMQAFFHPEKRDLFALVAEYDRQKDSADLTITLEPQTFGVTVYDETISGDFYPEHLSQTYVCGKLNVGTSSTFLAAALLSEQGTQGYKAAHAGWQLPLAGDKGRMMLLIGVCPSGRQHEVESEMKAVQSIDAFQREARAAWIRRWGTSMVQFQDNHVQRLFVRSLWYVLCSHGPDVLSTAPPTGWTMNGWGFHFPHDLGYYFPLLLKLGHLDIAKALVENYHAYLPDMQALTRRIWGIDGAFWAWEFPLSRDSQMLTSGNPGPVHFQLHNGAYVSKMAYETTLFLEDTEWSRDIAWPLIEQTARFYRSLLHKDGDTWSIHGKPSMGQDEFGEADHPNYLCALFSACYALRTALSAAESFSLPLPVDYAAILQEGLSFYKLYHPMWGIFNTCETNGSLCSMGSQKHPVQLIPLYSLPQGCAPDPMTFRAYKMRGELCLYLSEGHNSGWTQAALWMAQARVGDSRNLSYDLRKPHQMNFSDLDFVQFYESSGQYGMPFFITSHGMLVTALLDAVVCDYWEKTDCFKACAEAWGDVAFQNIYTRSKETLSGEKRLGRETVHVIR